MKKKEESRDLLENSMGKKSDYLVQVEVDSRRRWSLRHCHYQSENEDYVWET